mmetsp:Transcript_12595/g.23622  ORF Transcript_12595/g.23622 Transcript_12595/m.23622 type:complete len:121 (-) Transcript_12595:5-367(-)
MNLTRIATTLKNQRSITVTFYSSPLTSSFTMPTAKKTMVKSNLSFPMVAASAMTFMCAQNSSIYSHALVTHSRSFKLHAFDLSNKSSRQFSTARQASVIDEMPISSDVPKKSEFRSRGYG